VGYGTADSLDTQTGATAKSLVYLGLSGGLVSVRRQDRRHYAQYSFLGIILLHSARHDGIIRKIQIWV